ncbi:XrtA system polysaccharide deacetylase [Alteromonas facilis]|uniref:XrtA system polysaccharide deacetylase n=1 Tax=Alteromonas facilis TaxID=2048004 RepID=UPI00196A4467|nr:XrtA system polysaccharide deacetylase [Alteromonas facilis]
MKSLCAMTVDVEEYFQVEAFADTVSISSWKDQTSRIEHQMDVLLGVFDQFNVKATFFTLGWVAKVCPQIIKRIVEQGHELASHGFMHQHITRQSRQEFADDIRRAKDILEQVSGKEIVGFRAPCFSIRHDNEWAHDEIAAAGYTYSSSSYPINHDLYGVPNAPATPYKLANGLLEIPVTTCNWMGKTLPAGGGGYFRLLPYGLFHYLFNKGLREHGTANFYTHPWEFDPEQPRLPGGFKSQFRHHVNQKYAANKLSKLCRDFNWQTMRDCYLGSDVEYPVYSDWLLAANVNSSS